MAPHSLTNQLTQCQPEGQTTPTTLTLSFLSIEIPKKVFGGFDNISNVYLMWGFQKYERN